MSFIVACILIQNMSWIQISVMDMSQETFLLTMYQEIVLLCRFFGLLLFFFLRVFWYVLCVPLVVKLWFYFFTLMRSNYVYWDLYFACITLTIIGMSIINWFTRKPNVDVGNEIFPYIIFSVNAASIKDCLKYWHPSPMIIHMISWMVSSSYISGCSAWPLMKCFNFHSSLYWSHFSPNYVNIRTV